jgi:PKD repeat protein
MSQKHFNLLFVLGCVAGWVSSSAQGQGFEFGNYQVVSSTRVGRTKFEYVMRVTLTNKAAAAQGITAQVFSRSADTVIVEGNVSFGDVGFGTSATGADTFTLRQSRLIAFNPTNLQWFVSAQSMALAVTVTEPVSGLLTNGTSVRVSGTVGPAVDGVRVGGTLATLTGTNFTAIFALEEGRNTISVVATNSYGGAGVANVIVNRDTTAPILSIDTPAGGSVLAARQVTVTGQINDIVPGTVNPEQATVMVNGLPATIVNRSYAITDVLLAPGRNTITAIGRDRAGNESQRQIEVTLQDAASQKRLVTLAGDRQTGIIGTVLPEALVVELVDGDGVVQTNQPVTFTVSRNDGRLFATPDSGRSLTVLTGEKGQAGVLFQLGSRSGVGNNEVSVTSPGVAVPLLLGANGTGAPPARVAALIPETQAGQVGRPLPLQWTAFVTDAGGNPVGGASIMFSVSQGDGNIGGATTVVTNTDSDGRAVVIHTLGPDAGVNNNVVTASVPGVSNSAAVFTASGKAAGPANQTRILGVVLDNANRPMSNILCRIQNTLLVTATDTQGQFVLSNAPVGAVRLIVDAQNRGYPGEWHTLQFDLVTVAGRDNSVDRPIYMLPLDAANSVIAGGAQDVTLRLEGVPGSSLTILAHSLRDPNNQPITNRIMWTQVNLERVPMAPPLGSQFTLAWTVQPINMRFNPPARVCVPNKGFPPGQVLEMFGFDHDINAFVSLGQGTVSGDGAQICSNPGFGITKSGWGGAVPPPPPCTPVCGPAPQDTDCVKYDTIPPATKCDCPTYKKKETKITSVDAKVNGMAQATVCTNEDANFTASAMSENCAAVEYEWDFGDGTAKVKAANTSHKYTTKGSYTATVTAKCTACPSAQKSGSVTVKVASLTTRTVATVPTDRTRLTIGSCEEVDVTSTETGNWNVSAGGGMVAPPSGTVTRFTAPEAGGASTVTITFPGGGHCDIAFTVTAPGGVTMFKHDEIAIPAGTQGAGMHTDILITPINVSYYNIEILEIPGPASNVTGYYANYLTNNPGTDISHHPGTAWVGLLNTTNLVNGRDTASQQGYPPPWSVGGFDWIIPWNYRCVGTAGGGSLIANVTQSFRITGTNGATTVSKAGASVSRTP